MPGDRHRDAKSGQCNQQDRAASSVGLIPSTCNRLTGQLEMPIADGGRQTNGAAQDRIGLLVILHQPLSLGGQ